jgi:hypothetical protein
VGDWARQAVSVLEVWGSDMSHTFYLGAPEPCWLSRFDVPMMISRRRLARVRSVLPRALGPVLIDSSGFTELLKNGCWTVPASLYVSEVQNYVDDIGNIVAAAIQDWMCEPWIIAKTGLSVLDHQRRTVRSYLELRAMAPHLPWMPVIQGWSVADYLRCVDMYAADGVDLRRFPVVGVGSVCRRQATSEAVAILSSLAALGLKLHGFGFKTDGLPAGSRYLVSSDSMAWSADARRSLPLDGCEHKNCANCSRYALLWRERVVSSCAAPVFGAVPARSVYRRRGVAAASDVLQLSF